MAKQKGAAAAAEDEDVKAAEEEAAKKAEEEAAAKKARGDYIEDKDDDKTDKEDEAEEKDEEQELADELDAEEKEKKKASPIMIPKHRFDSANQRAKQANVELEKLRAELEEERSKNTTTASASGDTSDDLNEKLAEIDAEAALALKDGDHEKAAKLMGQARIMERQLNHKLIEENSSSASNKAIEQMRLDVAIDSLTASNPIFDPDAEDYDQDIVDEALDLHKTFMKAGVAPADALYKAVELTLRGVSLGPNEATTSTEKKKTDLKKNIETAKKQPPDTDGVGEDADSHGNKDVLPSPNDLTEEEFDALPEETKRRMRGDVL